MSSIISRNFLPKFLKFSSPIFRSLHNGGIFGKTTIFGTLEKETRIFGKLNRSILSPAFFCSDSGDENSTPRIVDKYLVPATVVSSGVFIAPGILPMVTKPIYLWFYRQFYDVQFDMNEFLVGARRALYFVAEKAFRKDFFGLRDVVTPEAMESIREMARDESFRFYMNLRAPSTPILYERVGAAGFFEKSDNSEDDHIQYYDRSNDAPAVPEYRFEILVFFVCQIERLLVSDKQILERNADETRPVVESGVKHYTRLLITMTFSRLLKQGQSQSSDWQVSSLALMPLQFTLGPK